MEYFMLTDPLRRGELIGVDGRRHYRFSFGPNQWLRTTAFQPYLTRGTECYGQYVPVSELQLPDCLVDRGLELSAGLREADRIARQAWGDRSGTNGRFCYNYGKEVSGALGDLEEKTTALLLDLYGRTGWTRARLRERGVSPRVLQALDLLDCPEELPDSECLRRVRSNRIARAVMLAQLQLIMERFPENAPDDSGESLLKFCREAAMYLAGDVSTAPEPPTRRRQRTSMEIYQQLRPLSMGGRKTPHSLSNPVLRRRGERLCMAFFVYAYSRQDLQEKMIPRPCSWMLADLADGALLEEVPCSREDFSDAPVGSRWSAEMPEPVPAGALQAAYDALDRLRAQCPENTEPDRAAYEDYLSRMLACVPPAFRRFYRELSLW